MTWKSRWGETAGAWKAPEVSSLPSWEGAARVAVDLETTDPGIGAGIGPAVRPRSGAAQGAIVGISFAIEDGPAFYLPVGHREGNVPRDVAFTYLRDQARGFRGSICGANLQYDLDYLWEAGVWFPEVGKAAGSLFRDVQVAEPLLWEHFPKYSLDAIAAHHGLPGKSETGMVHGCQSWGLGENPKVVMADLPARHVAEYAIRDVRLPLHLLRRQEKMVEEMGLERVYELECRVLPVLLKMRRRGVRVDASRLDLVEATSRTRELAAIARIRSIVPVGCAVTELDDVQDPGKKLATIAALDPALVGRLGLTDKKKPSVAADAFEDDFWREGTGRALKAALDEASRWCKIRNTFVESVRTHLTPAGRIHCSYTQLRTTRDSGDLGGAGFGRLACVDPNLQQQPARDEEIGPLWRAIYVPEDGERWASLDYSSQEPRIAVHYAAMSGLAGVEPFVRGYRECPAFDCHQMTTDLCFGARADDKENARRRKKAKTIFLGTTYGMGILKLCRNLGFKVSKVAATKEAWRDLRRLVGSYEDEDADPTTREKRTYLDGNVLHVPAIEAVEMSKRFHAMVPWVRGAARHALATAEKLGYTRTGFLRPGERGMRRCRFLANFGRASFAMSQKLKTHDDVDRYLADERRWGREAGDDSLWHEVHKALNRFVQGTAGDQTKTALVELDRAGWPLSLQVHDEVCGSVPSCDVAREGARMMEECFPLAVPSKVDVAVEASWGDCR